MVLDNLTDFQGTYTTGTGEALVLIPKYKLTVNRIQLALGGTTFTKAMITRIRLLMGTKPVYEVTGSDLDKINKYKRIYDDAAHLTVDFNERDAPDIVGKEIGGYDMTQLADPLYLKLNISGATAPTLAGKTFYTPPQDNPLVTKLIPFSQYFGNTGAVTLTIDPKGALLKRLFMNYTGTDWCGASATATAWTGNTGDGAMGAITVSAATKIGTYKLVIVEPGTNVGTFVIFDPDGVPISKKGAVASAFSAGGLAFTLADGATDFAAGDGFDIVVSSNNGNLSSFEAKKNGVTIWNASCKDARFIQQEYQRVPQSKMYVYEPIVDNNQSGALVTADASSLEFKPTITAADTISGYMEVLDQPGNLSA